MNNNTQYKIDNDIPYHNHTTPKGEYKYPFHLMKTGDSFRSKTGKDEHARVRQAMSARKKRHTNDYIKGQNYKKDMDIDVL